jgi:hypothetical protein
MKKGTHILIFCVLLLIVFSSYALAISAYTRSGRIVINAEVGEKVERTLFIPNRNDVSVKVNLDVSGDLEEQFSLEKTEFILQPGEEERVIFNIDVTKPGNFQTRIVIGFSELDSEGPSPKVASVITLTAVGQGELPDTEEGDNEEENQEAEGVDVSLGEAEQEEEQFSARSVLSIMLVATSVILVILIVVLLKAKTGKRKK